jgi:hypothetical protein
MTRSWVRRVEVAARRGSGVADLVPRFPTCHDDVRIWPYWSFGLPRDWRGSPSFGMWPSKLGGMASKGAGGARWPASTTAYGYGRRAVGGWARGGERRGDCGMRKQRCQGPRGCWCWEAGCQPLEEERRKIEEWKWRKWHMRPTSQWVKRKEHVFHTEIS